MLAPLPCRDGVREEAAAVRSFEEAGAAALRTQVRGGQRQGLLFSKWV
jgi:hypothetical protein